jgi:transposase-like protein
MLIKIIKNTLEKLTVSDDKSKISQTREARTGQKRDKKNIENRDFHLAWSRENISKEERARVEARSAPQHCPYCMSQDIVKRGKRKKKHEIVQLYKCSVCQRTFTPQTVKGKHYPLKLILDGLSIYNLGYTLEDTCRLLKEKYGIAVKSSSLSNWVSEFSDICRYSRMRPYGIKLYSPHQVIRSITLHHRQVYQFRYHQAKLALLVQEEYRNRKFWPLREWLEAIYTECPHQFFQDGLRASELPVKFSLKDVMIVEKQNYANRIAQFVLQAVQDNKLRHETLQQFMLANDSVTVAVEAPIYLTAEDIEHMESQLGFEMPFKLEKVLTGHIDILQLRNGLVHIIDYKPKAKRRNPYSQLTLYALALSRLTGLRLYDFKCAWFDENNYFEFFPLHMVYKLQQRQKRTPQNQPKLLEVRRKIIS